MEPTSGRPKPGNRLEYHDIYEVASTARSKLQQEADSAKRDMRLLVCHANFLDGDTYPRGGLNFQKLTSADLIERLHDMRDETSDDKKWSDHLTDLENDTESDEDDEIDVDCNDDGDKDAEGFDAVDGQSAFPQLTRSPTRRLDCMLKRSLQHMPRGTPSINNAALSQQCRHIPTLECIVEEDIEAAGIDPVRDAHVESSITVNCQAMVPKVEDALDTT